MVLEEDECIVECLTLGKNHVIKVHIIFCVSNCLFLDLFSINSL